MRLPLALTTGVALAVFLLALDGGAFSLTTRGSLAIGVWWTIAVLVGLGLTPKGGVPRAALVTGGFLAAFVVWTGASIAWADSAERALTEFNRAALYLGVFVLAVLGGASPNTYDRLLWQRRRRREAAGTKLCECGCGTEIPALPSNFRPARFAHGHNWRSPAA
jgi:hypothetical protein